MQPQILELIDKKDTFEIIRDQIAAILVLESANQQTLASVAGKNPNDWKLNIYLERSNPWDKWIDVDSQTERTPIVNVWFDTDTFPTNAGNIKARQKCIATYNIDCYGLGFSSDEGLGHKAGDKDAAFEVQRAMRLVRNILMSAQYTFLGLRGTAWDRWIQSRSSFQPVLGDRPVQNVHGGRIVFSVSFNEFSFEYQGEDLELISAKIKRSPTDELFLRAEYP